MPGWVKALLDEWPQAANLTTGNAGGQIKAATWGDGLTEKAVWHVVREYAAKAGIDRWRVGANSVLARACLDSDDRAVPRLQAAHSGGRQ